MLQKDDEEANTYVTDNKYFNASKLDSTMMTLNKYVKDLQGFLAETKSSQAGTAHECFLIARDVHSREEAGFNKAMLYLKSLSEDGEETDHASTLSQESQYDMEGGCEKSPDTVITHKVLHQRMMTVWRLTCDYCEY